VTASIRIAGDRGGAGLLRWGVCGFLVLAAHALALASLRPDVEDADADSGSPVAFIELAPMAVAAPAPPSDLAPGPVQSDSEANDSERQVSPPSVERPEAEPKTAALDPPPPLEAPQNQTAEAPAASDPPPPVETPAPPPQPIAAQADPPSEVSVPSAPPSAAEIAPLPAGPAIGRVEPVTSPRTARWQLSLVAHIERFKRYPNQGGGKFGVARLAFTIDRQGRLRDVRVVGGSGSPILDEEALATIQRAEPFPAPPDSVSDDELSFVLPIRYAPSAER
jgi:protein TonB